MPDLHLFNPENDLALAHGEANYTPPKPVQIFHNALQALPLWYAAPADCVYAPDVDPQWWQEMNRRFGLDVTQGSHGRPNPWGWSAHAVQQFRRIGISEPFPDVNLIRQLSHRRTTVSIHRHLTAHGLLPYPLPPEPVEATTTEQAMEHLTSGDAHFIKSPWSSSGRGVMDCTNMEPTHLRHVVQGIIDRQGSVMIERKLQRKRDFAMLFECRNGAASYRGLSLFFNSNATAYGGNIVAPQSTLQAMLGIDAELLQCTATAVERALTDCVAAKGYEGPVGVDMMLYSEQRICPIIEVNVRRTMGFVALSLARFATDKPLCMRVIPNPTDVQANDALHLVPPSRHFAVTLSALP